MAKKPPKPRKKPEKQADQSERFKATARELEAAGELNLAESEKAFERGIKKIVPPSISRNRGNSS